MSDLFSPDEKLLHLLNQQTCFEGELIFIDQHITNSFSKFLSIIQSFDIEQLGKVKIMVASHMQMNLLEPAFGIYMVEQIDHRIRMLMDKNKGK